MYTLQRKAWTSWVCGWNLGTKSLMGPQSRLPQPFCSGLLIASILVKFLNPPPIARDFRFQTLLSTPHNVPPLYSGNGSFSSIDPFWIAWYQRQYTVLFLHMEQTEALRAWVTYPKVTWVHWVGNCIKRKSFQLILWTLYVLPNMSVPPHGSLFFCAIDDPNSKEVGLG